MQSYTHIFLIDEIKLCTASSCAMLWAKALDLLSVSSINTSSSSMADALMLTNLSTY